MDLYNIDVGLTLSNFSISKADPRTTTCANQANDVLGYAVSAK